MQDLGLGADVYRWDEPMELPEGAEAAEVGVGQYRPGLNFGQFSELTVKRYYHTKGRAVKRLTDALIV